MPEWTCGRCTFINHELMANCEMCNAPKEAAEIRYLGDQEQPTRSAENTSRNHEGPRETITPMDHQSSEGPFADDMLDARSEMSLQNDPSLQPERSPAHSFNERYFETSSSGGMVLSEEQSSHSVAVNGTKEQPKLPEPLTPVVLHSLEVQEPVKSPMSEPEHIEEAMCIPSPDKAMSDDDSGWSFLENEVRLVMIGKTGVGKSTTGNNILGNNTFKSSASGASVTKKCQLGWASRFNKDIQIIDTPGLFDTGMSNEDITREVVKCIGMTSPGPHAFILVIRLDRFTAEEKATVDHFINIFGKDMAKYLIVLFTRMDDLKYDGTSLDEYVLNVPQDLKSLLELCQQRYIGFDNRGTKEERSQDVQNLLQMVDRMVKGNGGGHYTNEMFEEAERIIAEQEEEHLKRNREEMKLEMERLRAEVEEELRRKDEEQKKELDTMKGQLSELGIDEEDEEWVQVLNMSQVDEPMKSVEVPVYPNNGPSVTFSVPTDTNNSIVVNGNMHPMSSKEDTPEKRDTTQRKSVDDYFKASDAVSRQPRDGDSLSQRYQNGSMYEADSSHRPQQMPVSAKEDTSEKRDTTQRKSADDYFKASDAVSRQPRDGDSLSQRQQNGSMYEAHSSHRPQQMNTYTDFETNEPAESQSLGGQSEYDIRVQKLKERAARINQEHQREKERMRADYIARQSAAYESFNRMHRESRQRTREEMNNVRSNVFTRMFGAVKRLVLSTTCAIGRGFRGLFQSVHNRSSMNHRQSYF